MNVILRVLLAVVALFLVMWLVGLIPGVPEPLPLLAGVAAAIMVFLNPPALR